MKGIARAPIAMAVGLLVVAGTAMAADLHLPGDPLPGAGPSFAADPCGSDTWCGDHALSEGFVADGEWDPVSGNVGFVTTINSILVRNAVCAGVSATDITGGDFPGPVTRSFAWGRGQGDSWVGSWVATGAPAPQLYHLDATFAVIAAYSFPDSGTGLNMQFSGLALDRARGHLWGILRNNPAGTLSRFVELDVNVDPPVVLQGPLDVPWPGGPSAVSSAGLEYNQQDCTILAMRQDANNVGVTSLVLFQDVNPVGKGGVALLGECSIANSPCTGGGQGSNRPWGIALIESPAAYVVYSDLNLATGCGTIEQPADFHIIGLPPFSGLCVVPVTERTWGGIKALYRR